MNSHTFRDWLRERGCSFEQTERTRGEGVASVVVRRGPRRAELPLSASRQDLDPDVIRRIADELELDTGQLPGPQSRV